MATRMAFSGRRTISMGMQMEYGAMRIWSSVTATQSNPDSISISLKFIMNLFESISIPIKLQHPQPLRPQIALIRSFLSIAQVKSLLATELMPRIAELVLQFVHGLGQGFAFQLFFSQVFVHLLVRVCLLDGLSNLLDGHFRNNRDLLLGRIIERSLTNKLILIERTHNLLLNHQSLLRIFSLLRHILTNTRFQIIQLVGHSLLVIHIREGWLIGHVLDLSLEILLGFLVLAVGQLVGQEGHWLEISVQEREGGSQFCQQVLHGLMVLYHNYLSTHLMMIIQVITNLKIIQKSHKMSFPVLEQYKTKFPAHTKQIQEFQSLYSKKLWHELSESILHFIYANDVKGKLSFNFYTDFVKKFDRNIDQINHLRVLKESLANVPAETAIAFLEGFEEKDAFTDQNKAIVAGLRANYYVGKNGEKSSELYHRLQKFVKQRKDIDSFAYSTFYKFAYNYFLNKNRQKPYYQNALQYLAYTSGQQMQEKHKIELLSNMGIAILCSPEIYNFSQLLEQPLLKSLENSPYKWVYELLYLFNQGDIGTFNTVIDDASSRDKRLQENRKALDQKIRLMAFLELAFNLPKSNRIISFEQLSKTCEIPLDHVEFMVMKAAALKLVKVDIDQIAQQVTVIWMAPKVLSNERIDVMLGKFKEWETGIKDVEAFINENWKIKA